MYRRIDKRWLLGSFIHRSNPHHITGKNEVKEFTGMWPLKPRPVRIQIASNFLCAAERNYDNDIPDLSCN
jgi:hypothetical protein